MSKNLVKNSANSSLASYKSLDEECGGVSINNGSVEFIINSKDLANHGEGLERKIETINNAGYSFDVKTTETLIAEVLHQRFFHYGKDMEGKDITLERLLPIDSSGIGAYQDSLKRMVARQILNYDKSAGLSPFGSKGSKSQTAEVDFDYISIPNYALEMDITYDLNEVRQAQYSRVAFNLIDEKEKATANMLSLSLRDNILGGNNSFNSGKLNGLFNISGVTEDTTTIPSNPALMSQEDFFEVVQNLIKLRNDPVRQTLLNGLNTLLIPMEVASILQGQPIIVSGATTAATGMLGSNRLSYLKSALPGVEVIECQFGNKDSISDINPFIGAKYEWIFYSNDKDVLQSYMPVTPSLTGYGTANNFMFQSKLMTQFTGVWLFRPAGYVMMTHA
jgi:hypothetical protein